MRRLYVPLLMVFMLRLGGIAINGLYPRKIALNGSDCTVLQTLKRWLQLSFTITRPSKKVIELHEVTHHGRSSSPTLKQSFLVLLVTSVLYFPSFTKGDVWLPLIICAKMIHIQCLCPPMKIITNDRWTRCVKTGCRRRQATQTWVWLVED